jgi:DNA replication protein DnaC
MTFLDKFKEIYKENESVEFSESLNSGDSMELFKVLFYYFTKNDKYRDIRLLKRITSYNDGLIIIGTCGTGKTSIVKALKKTLEHFGLPSFIYRTASELTREYNPLDPESFYEKYSKQPLFIDEILKESKHENIIRLLEIRDSLNLRTYLCTNYKNVESSEKTFFAEVSEKYGHHITSRLLTMNLIKTEGKDLRWQI